MMKKRILFLPRWYPNRLDIQLGVFIREQALLLKDDFDICVVYAQADPATVGKYEVHETDRDGIREILVYFKSSNSALRKAINAKRYRSAQQMGMEKAGKTVDLCHVHVPYRSAFAALQLLRDQNTPFVITEHWSGHLTGAFGKKNSWDRRLYRKVLAKAAGITTVSGLLRQKFRENTGFDSVLIPNFIRYSRMEEAPKDDNKIHLLSVSDLDDVTKNVSGLLDAFAIARSQNDKLRLKLIGGGPDETRIKKQVEDAGLQNVVTLAGRLPHENVLQAMHHCDFYVCNSNFETFGMAVAEALRCGKPVICTRCGGPEEFVSSDSGFLVETRNPEQLAKTILHLATTFSDYNAEKIAGEMENRFGEKAVRKQWVDFYNKISGSGIG